LKKLFSELQIALDTEDVTKFDSLFKDFREDFQVNRGSETRKKTKLGAGFVKKLLGMLIQDKDKSEMVIYPEETIQFLLDEDLFSRDLLPDSHSLVPLALSNSTFLKQLLDKVPTPFTYREYLDLVKHHMTSSQNSQESILAIIDSFERDADTFFNTMEMKSVLTLDELHRFLSILTTDSTNVAYPKLLSNVLDSYGLGPLVLTPSLSTDLIDSLQSSIQDQHQDLSTCLEASSLISLLLQRQQDIPLQNKKDRALMFKERRGPGWIETVAQEDGMNKRRRTWMKKPVLPGSGREVSHRFVATAKFQNTPQYSLDRVIM